MEKDSKKEFSLHELRMCLDLWEKQGYCEFGEKTMCEQCAAPYGFWKGLTGEVLHGRDMKRLFLQDWKERLNSYNP
jgi:hypothetical protein